jgi:hypothetical protein
MGLHSNNRTFEAEIDVPLKKKWNYSQGYLGH